VRLGVLEDKRDRHLQDMIDVNKEGGIRERSMEEKLHILEGDRNLQLADKTDLNSKVEMLREVVERYKEDLVGKDILIKKFESENHELHKVLQAKKDVIQSEINNMLIDHKSERKSWEDTREGIFLGLKYFLGQLRRIQELECILRGSELENSKLRNDYQRLADILQTNITRVIYQTFTDTENLEGS
jgi:hypothetical protein